MLSRSARTLPLYHLSNCRSSSTSRLPSLDDLLERETKVKKLASSPTLAGRRPLPKQLVNPTQQVVNPDATQLFVGRLPRSNHIPRKDLEEKLWETFGGFGDVEAITVTVSADQRQIGYIKYKSPNDAQQVLRMIQTTPVSLFGRNVSVKERGERRLFFTEFHGTRETLTRVLEENGCGVSQILFFLSPAGAGRIDFPSAVDIPSVHRKLNGLKVGATTTLKLSFKPPGTFESSRRILLLGNIRPHVNINTFRDTMAKLFESFGPIRAITFPTVASPGQRFCHVRFENAPDAHNAAAAIAKDPLMFAGRTISATLVHKSSMYPRLYLEDHNQLRDGDEVAVFNKFSDSGQLKSVEIVEDTNDAIVEFDSVASATEALMKLNGRIVDGQPLKLRFYAPIKPTHHPPEWVREFAANVSKEAV